MKHSFPSMKSQTEIIELSSSEDLGNDTYLEHSLSPVESMECDRKYFPLIGEEFQAEIPVLVNKSDYLSEENNPTEAQTSSLKFMTGLAIPVIFLGNRDNNGCLLVPYSASERWNDIEKESFLLGLYIYEKNIIQLKNFVESKRIQDIQSYYYGMFYRSQEYLRWSACRRSRGRKCVVGEKLFIGVRLQELLSRILLVVSEECKDDVLQVSKLFSERKTTLEDFVISLKSLVGMNNLVEAVGIGKGKKDLTCILEPLKSYKGNPTRPEIPNGKAYSSLTSSEILKYLNGNCRLSKARSNELFWDAVWPRLLTKGWHSEKPKDNLVFIIPGIGEFCRRTLVKGNHYFDCVSDVLNKVASDPGLLEITNEEDEIEKNIEGEEDERKNHQVSEQDDVPNQIRYSYLQPIRGTDGMRFTVVDTSLANGELHKLTQVRYLSVDIFSSFNSNNSLKSFNQHGPNASADEVQTLQVGNKMQEMHNAYPTSQSVPMNDDTNNKLKRGLGHRTNEDDSSGVAPDIKRRRWFTASSHGGTCNVVTSTSTIQAIVALEVPNNVARNPTKTPFNPEPVRPSCGRATHDNVVTIPSSDVSLESSSKSTPAGSIRHASVANPHMFDLNLPPNFDSEPSLIEETREHNDEADVTVYNDASNMYQEATCTEQQTYNIPQRRSTRNRPPTTRALEALVNGFLTVNTRRRGRVVRPQDTSTSRDGPV